jgi:hypothetical protein
MFIARPSMKDVQATGEALIRENIQHFKTINYFCKCMCVSI